MGAKETLELISKQWCDLNDLMKLTQVGRNNALKIKNEIRVNLFKNKMNEIVSLINNL